MSRLFISHSSKDNDSAIALRDWLVREGWSGPDDVFLDLDPERGIAAGQRWATALEEAATRCEAVLFLVSERWLASKWCGDEYQLAKSLNAKLFALLLDNIPLDRLPGGLTAQWQVAGLYGGPAERFVVNEPLTQVPTPVYFSQAGLTSLKRGLEKAGIGPESFELQPDRTSPFGWRAPYRGLEALEADDAAVFFGRRADLVRGINSLRGLAARHPPRLLVILGASGAGKSSYLRAGLWPRLYRDDSQWLPLKVIRAGRDGAIDGGEGLLAALEDVHRRFALRTTRAELRKTLAQPDTFVALLHDLRHTAAQRARISQLPFPLPVLCLDQGEEFFAADRKADGDQLLQLARAAIEADEALLLVTIRSDAFSQMQSSKLLVGIDPVALSLGPVPSGEIAQVIRGPSEVLRSKAGPLAPLFDADVVETLQAEIAGETDALPLLAFVLQRLTREHVGTPVIGLDELAQTGGVGAAIEAAADAALADAGIGSDRGRQRDALRRLFIPHLARIDRESKTAQRRVAPQRELPPELAPLARALTERRLLVVKRAALAEGTSEAPYADSRAGPTLEVAHEALLRRWPMLSELLTEDRDALLLLDGVLASASDWERADDIRKSDFLTHRGSRLLDGQALSSRGTDWDRAVVPARAYLLACQTRDDEERLARETSLARRLRLQRRVTIAAVLSALIVAGAGLYAYSQKAKADASAATANINLNKASEAETTAAKHLKEAEANLLQARINQSHFLARESTLALKEHDPVTAVNLALEALPAADKPDVPYVADGATALLLGLAELRELTVLAHDDVVNTASFNTDGRRVVTASNDQTARVWDPYTGRQMVLLKHDSEVWSASINVDDSRVVTRSKDTMARLWDAATGTQIARLKHDGAVTNASFSADGGRVITASDDKTARVWDARSGKQLALLEHDEEVSSAAFSPDGRRIVTVSYRVARVWDTATGTQLALVLHDGAVNSASFSADGSRVITTSDDKTARVSDVATGKQLTLLEHNNRVYSASFSADGSRVVTADDKAVRVWDAATGKLLTLLDNGQRFASFNADGSRVVTGYWRGAALWDAANGTLIALLEGASSASFSSGGSHIVTASGDKTARVWDASKQLALFKVEGLEGLRGASFTADGSRVVIESEYAARVLDSATGRQLTIIEYVMPGIPLRYSGWVSFSADGSHVVTESYNNAATLWDTTTGRQLAELKHDSDVKSAGFSADGSRIVTAADDNAVRVWDVVTGKQLAMFQHDHEVYARSFSADGGRIIVTDYWNKGVRVWDIATGKQVSLLQHDGQINCASFNAGGTLIATASKDKTARVWDATTGQQLALLEHNEEVLWASFSADGRKIVTASKDKTARVWDAATGKPLLQLNHGGEVSRAFFSPDDRRIVTASSDRMARVWDAGSGRQLALFKHDESVHLASFSPDGSRVVTASSDNTVRIWDASTKTHDDLMERARERVPRCLTAGQRESRFLSSVSPNWCYETSKWPLKPRRYGLSASEKPPEGTDQQQKLVRITDVVPGLPGYTSGLLVGDIVVSVNGDRVVDVESYYRDLANILTGGVARLVVQRDGHQLELMMKPRF